MGSKVETVGLDCSLCLIFFMVVVCGPIKRPGSLELTLNLAIKAFKLSLKFLNTVLLVTVLTETLYGFNI